MEIVKARNALRAAELPPWFQGAVLLLPLWMVALAVSAEGFPRPPISAIPAFILFFGGIAAAILLVWKGWAGPEYLLACILPLYFVFVFDEITSAYKTPFIFFCTLILSVGVIAYHHFSENHYLKVALPVLFAAAALTLLAANHAKGNFWAYQDFLGVGECFLDYSGCPALPANHLAWWSFFFTF